MRGKYLILIQVRGDEYQCHYYPKIGENTNRSIWFFRSNLLWFWVSTSVGLLPYLKYEYCFFTEKKR